MRVQVEPPHGRRGITESIDEFGHVRDVHTGEDIDALRDLERRGHRFRVDSLTVSVAEIAHTLRLGPTPRELALHAKHARILELVDAELGDIHACDRQLWISRLIMAIENKR